LGFEVRYALSDRRRSHGVFPMNVSWQDDIDVCGLFQPPGEKKCGPVESATRAGPLPPASVAAENV
jgi:hypothetical protein